MNEIKWLRLRQVAEQVLDLWRPNEGLLVEIYCATDLPLDTRAAVQRSGKRVEIVLNLQYNKRLDDVIKSVAHELAHVALKRYEDHDASFDEAMTRLVEKIKGGYND